MTGESEWYQSISSIGEIWDMKHMGRNHMFSHISSVTE